MDVNLSQFYQSQESLIQSRIQWLESQAKPSEAIKKRLRTLRYYLERVRLDIHRYSEPQNDIAA